MIHNQKPRYRIMVICYDEDDSPILYEWGTDSWRLEIRDTGETFESSTTPPVPVDG